MPRILLCRASVMAIAAASAVLGAPAYAQPKSTAEARKSSDSGIEEIVVTAQRRKENLQRAAISIEAVSSEEISRAGVVRPEDLSKIATGVSVSTGGNYPQFYIRGVGNYATNNYAEAAVATNVDGVYISRPWGGRGSFFDLDRIEILKGPQGTLYGRNASGGAINIITAKPRLGETSGYVEGDVGNYDLVSGTGAINFPVTDKLAIRAAGNIVRRKGYLDDEGTDDQKTQGGRLHVLYEPNTAFSLLLSGFYLHENDRGAGQSLRPWLGGTDPLVTQITLANTAPPGFLLLIPKKDSFNNATVYGGSAELNWNFGPATLTVIPAYRYGEHRDRFYVATYTLDDNETDEQTSVEVRLSNETSKLKWVVGGFFFNEDQANLPGHDLIIANAGISGERLTSFSSNIRSYAAFGQATYSVTSRLRITGGLRYTNESKNQAGLDHSYGGCGGPGFVPATDSPAPFAPCVLPVPLSGDVSYNSLTWKAGIEFDLGPNSLLYANMSTGFKSGGFYQAPPPNTFRPEKVTSYELGVKNRFLDNRLQVNAEAFFISYFNHQEGYLGPTSLPGYFTFIIANAGRANSYGGLLDIVYEPTRQDRLKLGVQYNKTKYDSYTFTFPTLYFGPPVTGCVVSGVPSPANPFQTIDCAGFQLVRTPTWTGQVSYDHRFDLTNGASITAGAQLQFSSGYYTSIDFLPTEWQGGYGLLDADLTYTSPNGKWAVTLWGRNLTDRPVFTQKFRSPFINNNALAGPDGLIEGPLKPPRTFGLHARFNF